MEHWPTLTQIWLPSENTNQFTWSLFCLGNHILHFMLEIMIKSYWENFYNIFEQYFSKKESEAFLAIKNINKRMTLRSCKAKNA